jgi:hypothetical protein
MKYLLLPPPLTRLLAFLVYCAAFSACTKLEQEVTPAPFSPSDPLPTLAYSPDSVSGRVEIAIDAATLNTGGSSYSISFTGLRRGRVTRTSSGNGLIYTITDTTNTWKADSATYSACLATPGTPCRSGIINIRNPRYKKRQDTLIPVQPDTNQTRILPMWYIAFLDTKVLPLAPDSAQGTRVRLSATNAFYTLTFSPSNPILAVYWASGGNTSIRAGFDSIRFEIKIGRVRYRGYVPITIGDTCEARARPDRIRTNGLIGDSIPITAQSLLLNDNACNSATLPSNIRLTVLPNNLRTRVSTKHGYIIDRAPGSGVQRTLYYYRLTAGPDQFDYYATGSFVSKSRVFID